MIVEMQSFKYVTYQSDSAKESKKIALVKSQVWVCDFLTDFYKKTESYVQHVHVARWQDEQYRKCRENFPIGTILSIVDFAENYTLQPQNEIQSQYYHSDQVSIMVHITYRHGPESSINNRIIKKETNFDISDDRCHDLHYVQ